MPARNRYDSGGSPDNGFDDDAGAANENPMSAAEEPRARTGGGTAYGETPRTTARKVTPKRAAAKKAAGAGSTGGGTTRTTGAKKSPAKKAPAKKAPAKKAAGGGATRKAAGAKKTAAKRTPGGTAGAAKKAGATRTTAGRTRAAGAQRNGKIRGLPEGKVARDYADAKRALSTLWEDVTKQTYSAFNNIAGRVEKNFNEARKNINEIDVRYALEKTQSKLKSVAQSGGHQVRLMGRQASLLYRMLKDAVGGRFKVPWATVSAATAALLYFISPLDILPDFIPGAGLIDDALVISMAISLARMDLRRYIQENDLAPEEYGL